MWVERLKLQRLPHLHRVTAANPSPGLCVSVFSGARRAKKVLRINVSPKSGSFPLTDSNKEDFNKWKAQL